MKKTDAVRNKNGIWINSQVFREEGENFMKYGSYCSDPWGSPAWHEYWKEQRRRCIEGYEVGGAKVTGDHYFYLNFCPIRKVEDTGKKRSSKITGFPDFWDGDFNYFWVREIARNGVADPLLSDGDLEILNRLPEEEKKKRLKELYNSLHLQVTVKDSHLDGGYNLIVGKSRRRGYEQPHSEIIMTPNGKSTMGDIQIGDEVLTPTGKTIVTDKFYQGSKDVYEVELFDGRKVTCGLNHLWKVYSQSHRKNYRQEKIIKTSDLITANLKVKGVYTHLLKINNEVVFDDIKDLPLPSYTVGAFLGDGNMIRQTRLSGIDDEINNRVKEEVSKTFPDLKLKITRRVRYWEYSFLTKNKEQFRYYRDLYEYPKIGTCRINPLYKTFETLGINCHGKIKHIPDLYKYNTTIEQRLDLVKGLMDTDGAISADGSCSFSSESERLVDDLQEVLYSLGITSTKRLRKDGMFILYINTNKNIFFLKRKAERVKPNRKNRSFIPIVAINKLEYQEECSCIEVKDREHLYLTKSYIPTHNSFKAGSIAGNNFFTRPDSLTILGAEDKKYLYPNGLFKMAYDHINFNNSNTAWRMPSDVVNKTSQGHIKASYWKTVDGNKTEEGFKSEIISLTFMDNPDAARGKDAYDVFFEESGAFGTPGLLKQSYAATQDCVSAGGGSIKTGLITIFGCVCKGTKVWTHTGEYVNIEDITKKTGIVGYASKGVIDENISWLKPPAKKECVRIETEKGGVIECSTDHPLLWTKRNYTTYEEKKKIKLATFKEAKDVQVGDNLLQILQMPKFGTLPMWNPRFLGLMLGDGYYGSMNTGGELAISEKEIFDYVTNLGIEYRIAKDKSCDEPYFRYVRFLGTQSQLRLLGLSGQSKFMKRVPDKIHLVDKISIAEYLGGYFDADGHVFSVGNRKKIDVVSVVKPLLEEIKELLFKLGIQSNIYKRKHKPGAILNSNVNKKSYIINTTKSYSLEICDLQSIRNFKKHIKLLVKKKQDRIDAWDLSERPNEKNYNYEYRHTIEKGDYFKVNNNLENLIGRKVTKVEFIGEQEVYNLSADYTHTYITNGFISHNTSGDMAGGTMDYSHMFSEPESYGLLAFENQWDKIEGITSFCGFFHPTNQNKEGFYDAQGNSDLAGATQFELDYRQKLLDTGATSQLIQQRMQENPLSPSEAFATASVNNFPVLELSNQLKKIQANNWQEIKGMPIQLVRNDKNELVADPILNKKLEPITSYNAEPSDKRGCIVIYEHPITDAPHGLYKIGYDPVRQDSGTSLASIIVYKSVHRNSYYHSTIVAEYIGRKETTEDIDKIAEDLAIYYNSKIMHENEVTGVKNYFRRRKRLDLLAVQPDKVISKNIKKSKVARVYGCHMNDQLKDAGERYVKDWLLTVLDYDENGNPITVIDRIYSRRLIEELINYNRKGNFDMVSALFMCMFQVQEEELDQVYDEKKVNRNAKDLQELMKNMYRKNNKKF